MEASRHFRDTTVESEIGSAMFSINIRPQAKASQEQFWHLWCAFQIRQSLQVVPRSACFAQNCQNCMLECFSITGFRTFASETCKGWSRLLVIVSFWHEVSKSSCPINTIQIYRYLYRAARSIAEAKQCRFQIGWCTHCTGMPCWIWPSSFHQEALQFPIWLRLSSSLQKENSRTYIVTWTFSKM